MKSPSAEKMFISWIFLKSLFGFKVAIKMVLDFILEKLHQKIQLNKVLILSDSQSSIGILTLGWDPTQHKITAKDKLTKMDLIKRRGIDIDILSFFLYILPGARFRALSAGVHCTLPVLCLGQDFWGIPVSPYLNFWGTFANSGGHTNSIWFLPVKLKTVFRKFLFIFIYIWARCR